MPDRSQEQASFAGGELDPELLARRDLRRYQIGLRRCRNFVVKRSGAVTRAPGTRWIAETKGSGGVRLIPFVFSVNDSFVLEFGNLYIRFFSDQAQVDDGSGSPLEITSPYATADIPNLQWSQTADFIYLVDGNHKWQQLRRNSATSWTIEEFPHANGPFAPQNLDESLTVSASAATGTGITLTASAALFVAGDVGSFFRLNEVDQSAVPEWTGNTTVSAGSRMRSVGAVYEVVSGTNTGVNPPVHIEGDSLSEQGGVIWRHIHNGFGVVKITAVASGTSATADVVGELPDGVISSKTTYRWHKAAFSTATGNPRAICQKEQRIWVAGTESQPRTIWFSAVGRPTDFQPGETEADSSDFTLSESAEGFNNINWLLDMVQLHIGTEGEEHVGQATTQLEALTPANTVIRPHSNRGSARLQPVKIGTTAVFSSADGTGLYEISFDPDSERFAPRDISIASAHFFKPGIKEMAWSKTPFGLLWIVMQDGSCSCMTFEQHEQVLAFAGRSTTSGDSFRSVAAVPADNGKRTDVYFIVDRVVGGVTKRYIECVQQPWDGEGKTDAAAAWYLDSALRGSFGSPTTTVTGLGHLEGREVAIWADGAAQPSRTVSGGAIELQIPASEVLVGLDYGGEIAPLSVLDVPDRAPGNKLKNIIRLAVHLKDSIGGIVRMDPNNPGLDELLNPSGHVDGAALEIVSGVREVPCNLDWSTDPYVPLLPSAGAPMTVLALTPVYQTSSD